MSKKAPPASVKMSFEANGVRLPIADIQPLRAVSEAVKKTAKYAQIAASIREVGIIEPPVVARDRSAKGKFLLLDGHLRLAVLRDLGATDAVCLISTDDEAFTYNRRVSRIAIIQEHKMLLKAVEHGVPADRIARALNVDVAALRQKMRLLKGICSEAAELLKDKHVPINSFEFLKRMSPLRQVEAAELMVAMNKYSISYAKSLWAATPQSQLADTGKAKVLRGLTDDKIALMERESANLEREFKMAEQSYSSDHLDLVLTKGYLAKLLGNARVVRYLAQHHEEILAEFKRIAEIETMAA